MSTLTTADWIVFIIYFLIVSSYGYWVYRRKRDADATSTDYFLAAGTLTWWAIGASLIASNISAEQMVGIGMPMVFQWVWPFPLMSGWLRLRWYWWQFSLSRCTLKTKFTPCRNS